MLPFRLASVHRRRPSAISEPPKRAVSASFVIFTPKEPLVCAGGQDSARVVGLGFRPFAPPAGPWRVSSDSARGLQRRAATTEPRKRFGVNVALRCGQGGEKCAFIGGLGRGIGLEGRELLGYMAKKKSLQKLTNLKKLIHAFLRHEGGRIGA
jgi:hypothetical protein